MTGFIERVFEGAPKEVLDQACRVNAAFKELNKRSAEFGEAKAASDLAEMQYKHEAKKYERMLTDMDTRTIVPTMGNA